MRRCLIVANQTLGGEALLEAVQQRTAAGEHAFFVVVPATPVPQHDVGVGGRVVGAPSAQERGYALARQRLDAALDRLRGVGASAEGEVGDADPLEAVRLAAAGFHPDEVIVSTLHLGPSRWLRMDLPSKVHRALSVPVTHVVGSATA